MTNTYKTYWILFSENRDSPTQRRYVRAKNLVDAKTLIIQTYPNSRVIYGGELTEVMAGDIQEEVLDTTETVVN